MAVGTADDRPPLSADRDAAVEMMCKAAIREKALLHGADPFVGLTDVDFAVICALPAAD